VNPRTAAEFPLYLRVPAWCARPALRVNGRAVEAAVNAKGFLRLARRWQKGDRVELTLPMTSRVDKGYETSFPQVRYFNKGAKITKMTGIHNPYASVSHGPLLFALPITDETPNQEKPGQAFHFALDGKDVTVERKPMPERWTWALDAPVRLTAPAVEFDWQPTEEQPLPAKVVEGGKERRIELVPYGCTKFRVSMFPVTGRV
jgi:hypothetical protein